ncbi:MAG: DUF4402 domain-containing protein [Gemmatimonadaceae bacterium]|nr:DUF4402 domain-containing protein [Gemmatimonadaceae bacterium]
MATTLRQLCALLAVAGAANTAVAQSASIAATATVVTPITVTGTAPLAFGNVFQGVDRTIAFSDATSGRFSLTGYLNAQVALTFTLPTVLTSGANTMPINTYDVRRNGTNVTAGATALTVTSGTPVNTNFLNGNLFVFVGGRVQPAAAQAAGSYTGSIVLTAAYTGL